MSASPTQPEFWDPRYAAQRTPWDAGGVPAALTRFLAKNPGRGKRALIPGCGSGYETVAFADAGYDVTALDFSAQAVRRAKSNVGPVLADRVIEGDFFTHDFGAITPFDLIYERTFLCALPPDTWPRLVARTAALLKPGGLLAGLYFFGDKDDGPPFGLAPGEPETLFAGEFTLVADEAIPAAESLVLFADHERWQERIVIPERP
jgi:SAM-dependent methyltransferase